MRILARCHDRVIVALGRNSVAVVGLRGELRDEDRRLVGAPEAPEPIGVRFDTGSVKAYACDGCRDNYGPRGYPADDAHAFQQFALFEGAYPWKANKPGWYCMGCSFPPR